MFVLSVAVLTGQHVLSLGNYGSLTLTKFQISTFPQLVTEIPDFPLPTPQSSTENKHFTLPVTLTFSIL